MGGIMETIIIVLQLCLDAAMLTLCCESVFRTRHTAKRKDLFLFPVLFVVCMASRSVITAGNEYISYFLYQALNWRLQTVPLYCCFSCLAYSYLTAYSMAQRITASFFVEP